MNYSNSCLYDSTFYATAKSKFDRTTNMSSTLNNFSIFNKTNKAFEV